MKYSPANVHVVHIGLSAYFFQAAQMEEAAGEGQGQGAAGARGGMATSTGAGDEQRVLCPERDCPPSVLLHFF